MKPNDIKVNIHVDIDTATQKMLDDFRENRKELLRWASAELYGVYELTDRSNKWDYNVPGGYIVSEEYIPLSCPQCYETIREEHKGVCPRCGAVAASVVEFPKHDGEFGTVKYDEFNFDAAAALSELPKGQVYVGNSAPGPMEVIPLTREEVRQRKTWTPIPEKISFENGILVLNLRDEEVRSDVAYLLGSGTHSLHPVADELQDYLTRKAREDRAARYRAKSPRLAMWGDDEVIALVEQISMDAFSNGQR